MPEDAGKPEPSLGECWPIDLYPDAVSGLDRQLRICQQSAASRELFGDKEGLPCYEGHFGRDSRCPGCQIDRVIEHGETARWYLADRKEGEDEPSAFYEITLLPVQDESGAVRGVVEILRDATLSFRMEHQLIETSQELDRQVEETRGELKKLKQDQAALVQAEKMASLGRLVAGLTHEIHTPLGTIVSSLELTRSLLAALDEEPGRIGPLLGELKSMLDLEQLATERIGKILGSLRIFAHLDRAEEEDFDLHVGISACLALLSHDLKQGVEVERDFGALPNVRCRPDAINQVFMNILQNAVQAMKGEGRIRVVTRVDEGRSEQVRLEFHDTGKGIPESNLDKIFEPGFTTKPRGVGTGLGLALAYSTVKGHRGTIEVESTPGEGSIFVVRLPIRGTGR